MRAHKNSTVKYRQSGFTIIEVVLFLGVTGLMAAGILVGMGTALASQRYKDAVSTFQSDIQQQYEDISAVKNNRFSVDGACDGDRGQSDCVLVGKLLTVSPSGQTMSQLVYGSERSAISDADDFAVIRSYSPQVTTLDQRISQMEWGTGVAAPAGGASNGVGILVVRSPQSGSIYTFTRSGTSTGNLSSMINNGNSSDRTLCVTPGGWTVADTMAIHIGASASSASAVEVYSQNLLASAGLEC